MAPTSEGKPISSRNICSRRGKRVPSREGWEQMERESFSSSCRRAAASEVHHLARLPAGWWCRRPGLHPHVFFSSCSKAGRELGGVCVEKRFNCSVQQEQTQFRSGARSHTAGGDAVLHLAACLRSGSRSGEERFAWSASPTSGKVRTVCMSGGRRRD